MIAVFSLILVFDLLVNEIFRRFRKKRSRRQEPNELAV